MRNSFERFFGEHVFQGCRFDKITRFDDNWQCERDFNTCLFALDGETYQLLEDPGDGYRSYCREIEISSKKIRPEFGIRVVCTSYNSIHNDEINDCMQVIDVINGKTILIVGTENVDDYYPYCLFDYRPENIHLNESKGD